MKRLFTLCSLLMAASASAQLTTPYSLMINPTNGQIAAPAGTKFWDSNSVALKAELNWLNLTNWSNGNAGTVFSSGTVPEARSAHTLTNPAFSGTIVFDTFGGYNQLQIDNAPTNMSMHFISQQNKFIVEPANGFEVRGGAPIYGNGSGISNLQSANLVGSYAALNGGAITGLNALSITGTISPSVLTTTLSNLSGMPTQSIVFASTAWQAANQFANKAGISDWETRRDLFGFATELEAAGVYVFNTNQTTTNLADCAFGNPRFKSGSNGFTWTGGALTLSNIMQSAWGWSFAGNGLVKFTVPDSRTNSLVIVWRGYTSNLNVGAQQWLGGLAYNDPSKYSAQWLYMDNTALKFTFRETNTFFQSLGAETLFQPWYMDAYDWQEPNWTFNQRRVTVTTTLGVNGAGGGGIYGFYNNGIPCKFGFTAPAFYLTNTAIVQTNALDTVILGVDPRGPGAGFFGGYLKGEIAFAGVFNQPLNSNQVAALYFALRWLEPGTVNRAYLGDSEFGLFPPSLTHCIPQFMEDSPLHTNDACWLNMAKSGKRLVNMNNATLSNYVFYMHGPRGKVTRSELYLEGGVNDKYGDGSSLNTISNSLFTITSMATLSGWRPYVFTVTGVATNSSSAYTYSAANEADLDALNGMIITNAHQFAGVVRRDLLCSQSELDTNLNTFSADGLHLSGANGALLDKEIADVALGSRLPPAGAIVTVMSAYTAKIGDAVVYAKTGSSFSVKLPPAPMHNEVHYVKKISSDGNTLTVDGNGRNIDGAATQTTTTQYAGFRCQYDRTQNVWFLLK